MPNESNEFKCENDACDKDIDITHYFSYRKYDAESEDLIDEHNFCCIDCAKKFTDIYK